MSAKILGQIWDLKLPPNQRIVLMAMADSADHNGENIYPSIGLIAWKVDYSRRQVQRIIKELKQAGILIEVRPATAKKSTTYKIDLSLAQKKPPYTSARGDNMSGVTSRCHRRGDTQMS
ncbi:hypothetical protein Nhal_1139 [Nitrosococcus halophilus Nc 4]|uniref:Helix-turn-helix domain-containing protein n=1 Tax=Nitrosococcus halophilus (strain Nc4) TaxID=472759 RepID=D5BZL2_NITHN|nr:hypothetical protein Nhal_1139 [Nitrosococcus halophilus Nc 4]